MCACIGADVRIDSWYAAINAPAEWQNTSMRAIRTGSGGLPRESPQIVYHESCLFLARSLEKEETSHTTEILTKHKPFPWTCVVLMRVNTLPIVVLAAAAGLRRPVCDGGC